MKQLIVEELTELGAALRKAREEQNMIRQVIVKKAGISMGTMHRVENGQGYPYMDVLLPWVEALGYDELVIKCKAGDGK